MKKTKVYRPRRGMRFSNGRRGVSPPAGFIGSDAISRTRPNNASHDDSDAFTVKISGDVQESTQGPLGSYEPFSPVISSSSICLQGSVSVGRMYERKKLDAQLISAPANSVGGLLPGIPPWPSVATMDVTNGILGVPTASSGLVQERPRPPSWTRAYMGESQAFIIPCFTGSDPENIAFNTYTSGRETLEASPTPATRAIHRVKEQRLQTLIVKKTASFFDTVLNQFNSSSEGAFFSRPRTFVPGKGTLVSEITTPKFTFDVNLTGSDRQQPCVITIDVPTSGRLVDLKVWLELQHDSSSVANKFTPLGTMAISLRSPNVTWRGYGTPIENDPLLVDQKIGFSQDDLRQNAYILWEGPGSISQGLTLENLTVVPPRFDSGITGSTNGNPRWHSLFAGWDRDMSMRTVFSDGSPVPNPRMNYSSNSSGNFIGAPNAVLGINSAWGIGTDWTGSSGSPPVGWLTGPGGVANVNEWPTTGTNRGTSTIRPIYPLLDPIYQQVPQVPGVITPDGTTEVDGFFGRLVDYKKLNGFRPGLRGTEISGTWRLLIAAGSISNLDLFNLWFKQVRLEFTYETGLSGDRANCSLRPQKPGANLLYSVSGIIGQSSITSTLNTFTTIPEQNAIARSFGIQRNSGAIDTTSALTYRLSGSLADIVGTAPGWLFTGPFGMPILPESSASLVPLVNQSVISVPFSDFLQPRRTLDMPQRLSDIAADANPQVRLRDLATAFISASAI